jgi:integrase
VWRWLDQPGTPLTTRYLVALRIIMACGTRVTEIAGLRAGQWDSAERLLSWEKTKNGRPHLLPVPAIAAELLDSLTPNEHGWYFPSVMDPTRPVSVEPLYCCFWRHRHRMTIPRFSNRDLRRTWKTLAGEAGLSKEDRDRLQNHGRWDVSTKHYDHYAYLPEKRLAMAVWSSWLDDLLRPDPARSKVRRIRRAA